MRPYLQISQQLCNNTDLSEDTMPVLNSASVESENGPMLLLKLPEILLFFRRIRQEKILEGSAHALHKTSLARLEVNKDRRSPHSTVQCGICYWKWSTVRAGSSACDTYPCHPSSTRSLGPASFSEELDESIINSYLDRRHLSQNLFHFVEVLLRGAKDHLVGILRVSNRREGIKDHVSSESS